MAVRASAATRWILVFQPPRDWPIACGPPFSSTSAVEMHLHTGTVQADGLDFDLDDLRAMQLLKCLVEHARLGPAAHARVDRVPVAEALGQPTPLAAVLGHIEDHVEHCPSARLTLPRWSSKHCSIWANCDAVISIDPVSMQRRLRATSVDRP